MKNWKMISKEVPEASALVVVSFPKPKDGSGFPARVFAIVPQGQSLALVVV